MNVGQIQPSTLRFSGIESAISPNLFRESSDFPVEEFAISLPVLPDVFY